MRFLTVRAILGLIALAFLTTSPGAALAQDMVHGLWVWKTPTILDMPGSAETLRNFCKAKGINEVYLSISSKGGTEDERVPSLIELLHKSNIRVEALLGSTEADKPGKHREQFLDQVRAIVQFNQKNPKQRFDGVHLDIEPQQRAENKGAGNIKYLPDLAETFRAVRAIAEPAKMMVNADIANKHLKGDANERRMLLTSVPRVTLMLYELNATDDGKTPAKKAEKLRKFSEKYLEMAYAGLNEPNLAKMAIALRTPDYGELLLPEMLNVLDAAHRRNPHYLGWGRHSYNDLFKK